MKALISGDWHIRAKKPRNRLDVDYFVTISNKIMQIFDAAKSHKVDFILQPGDMFDSHSVSNRIIRQTLKLLSHSTVPIYTVPGQHDLVYHSKIWQNTPIGVTDASNLNVTVLYHEIENGSIIGYKEINGVSFVGSAYNQPIIKLDEDRYQFQPFKILICHKLIVDTTNWKGNFSYDYDGTDLLKNHNYDLIVSGDNHQTFMCEHDGKTLINTGSLMRTRIDQVDHHPCYFIYDTKTRQYSQHFLKVHDVHVILDLEKAKKEKEQNASLVGFVNRIEEESGADDEELNFRKKLAKRMEHQKKKLGKGVVNILKEVMSEND